MKERVQAVGGVALGFVALIGLVFVASVLLRGSAIVSAWAYPFLVTLFSYTVLFVLPILVVLALIPKSRSLAGLGFFISSFLFGATLWVWSFLFTLETWGWLPVIVGFFMAGIGIVPIALLAAVMKGLWGLVGQLVLGVVITIAARLGGVALMGAEQQ